MLKRVKYTALIIGLVALVLATLLGRSAPQTFYQSYLFAFLFWFGLSAGALPIVMLHHLTGGVWGFLVRRPLEAAFRVLPLMAVLFIPFVFGLDKIYAWAQPDAAQHLVLAKKIWYLNPPFFYLRVVIYFAVLAALSCFLSRWSAAQDIRANHVLNSRLARLSVSGLILYALIALFSSTDLVMSLAPDWYSTTFGLLFGTGQMLSAMAFGIAVCAYITVKTSYMARFATEQRFNDLGNLLLMFVLTWTYLAFTQYLIIWYENLPPEISWYIPRSETSWRWLALFVVTFHFTIPFTVLLLRKIKRSVGMLGIVGTALVLIHAIEVFWMVMPIFRPHGFEVHWLDLMLFIGIGGLWLMVFSAQLMDRPLLPAGTPGLSEAINDA